MAGQTWGAALKIRGQVDRHVKVAVTDTYISWTLMFGGRPVGLGGRADIIQMGR